MQKVIQTVAGMLFYLFCAAILIWTGSLTVQEIQTIFPGDLVTPYIALALFDGGALAWLGAFLVKAKGMQQRATSLLMVGLDLFGVVLMVAGRVFTGGQQLTDIPAGIGNAVIYGLIAASVLNVVAVYYYHLNEPATREAIEAQSLEDRLTDEALQQARTNIEREAQQLGALLARRTTSRIKARLRLPMTEAEALEWQGETVDAQIEPLEAAPDSPFFESQSSEPISTSPNFASSLGESEKPE